MNCGCFATNLKLKSWNSRTGMTLGRRMTPARCWIMYLLTLTLMRIIRALLNICGLSCSLDELFSGPLALVMALGVVAQAWVVVALPQQDREH